MSEIQDNRIAEALKKGMSYARYREMVRTLAQNGQATGAVPDKILIGYTKLNDKRMDRLDKTLVIPDEAAETVKAFRGNVTWLILTESWCGDAAQTLPVINKIAGLNAKIDVKLVLRDENAALMDRFLTNGTRSIPKLIMVDNETGVVLHTWGPRPSTAAKMAAGFKRLHGKLTPEFKEELQRWYNKDKGGTTVADLLGLLL